MDSGTAVDHCRVTVIAPDARIDVVLPADVPLGDLVPTLLRQAGEDLADRGSWSLQRFGEVVLDLALPASAAMLRDGEILYLRPALAALPELAFDDVADAIATAYEERSRRWSERDTRRAGIGIGVGGLVLAAVALLSVGPPWTMPSIVAGLMASALLIGGASLSRAFGDAAAGVAVSLAGVGFAALAGAFLLAADSASWRGLDALSLLGAGAAALVVAPLAAALVGDGMPVMVGVAATALLALGGAALDLLADLDAASSAAAVAAVAVVLVQPIPSIAMRLADLPQPLVPLTADEVRRDVSTVDGEDVIRRTLSADRYVTGLAGAVGAALAGASALMATRPSGLLWWTLAVLAAVAALRARVFTGRAQRLWLLGAGVVSLISLSASVSSQEDGGGRLLTVGVPLFLGAVACVAAGLRLPGRRVSPLVARALDIVDALLVTAVLPLVVGVLGVYGYVRGLSE